MHFLVLQWCSSSPRLRNAIERRLFLVQLYFKYESAGNCRRKCVSAGGRCCENVCRKGHITVTTATVKTKLVHALKEQHPVGRMHFCNWFLQSVHYREFDAQFFSLCLWWGLIFVMWRYEFSEQPVLECRKSRTYSRTLSSYWKSLCLMCDECTPWDFNSFRRKLSKQ
jgi:hypothetical protein